VDRGALLVEPGTPRQDVVAPLAERIHREDLTVPEALLQPMRELGVFGLSIPEVYGGTSG
jgi:(2S)-methylsuccinyl-CoA dehydrogenase